MITLAEDLAWGELRVMIERHLWHEDDAVARFKIAASLTASMRKAGWRIPLPEGSEPPKLGRPLRPEVVKRNIQKCRDELRATRGVEDAG